MTRLWILIWNLSQVLEPSPQGVFLVVILRVLVGILTGPFTFSSLSLAPLIRSWQTFSRDFTFLEVRVILILWTGASSSTPFPSLYAAMILVKLFQWEVVPTGKLCQHERMTMKTLFFLIAPVKYNG